MKSKLLKKIRARFKLVRLNGNINLLDLKNKCLAYPFFDWHYTPYENYKRHMIQQVLGKEKYAKLKEKHRQRRVHNQQLNAFNSVLNQLTQ